MKDYNFQREALIDVREEAQNLIKDHWKEVESHQDKIPLDPDWEAYQVIEQNGNLGIYTCRKDKELIGYISIVATTALHHKKHIFANTDTIYLKPEYRHTGLSKKFIEYVENDLKTMGVSVFLLNMKVNHSFDTLMVSLGYEPMEKVYSKCLLEGSN